VVKEGEILESDPPCHSDIPSDESKRLVKSKSHLDKKIWPYLSGALYLPPNPRYGISPNSAEYLTKSLISKENFSEVIEAGNTLLGNISSDVLSYIANTYFERRKLTNELHS